MVSSPRQEFNSISAYAGSLESHSNRKISSSTHTIQTIRIESHEKPVSLNGWAFQARNLSQDKGGQRTAPHTPRIPYKSDKVGRCRDERRQQRYVHIQEKNFSNESLKILVKFLTGQKKQNQH